MCVSNTSQYITMDMDHCYREGQILTWYAVYENLMKLGSLTPPTPAVQLLFKCDTVAVVRVLLSESCELCSHN